MDKNDEKIIHLIRPDVQTAQLNHTPPARGLIKLDAMESPYSWPAYLRGEWLEELQGVALNRYPDPQATELKARLRQVFDIPPGLELLLGNGSDELLQTLSLAMKGFGDKVVAPVPTFSMCQMTAMYAGMKFVGVPLQEDDFSLDMPAMLRAVERHQPVVVYLGYPNNPTGNLFAEQDVVELLEATPGLVVIDESSHAYSGVSLMHLMARYDNLLILRSLANVGFAGVRLAYLVGRAKWIAQIENLRLPFNINALTQFTVEFALTYYDIFEEQVDQVRRDREWVAENIRRLPNIDVFPSETNFLLFRVAQGCGDKVDSSLKDKGVLLKNLDHGNPHLRDCLRVTIGKPSENVAFLSALTSSL